MSWGVVEHGSFLLGHCQVCRWTSPARRARYSVEADMRAHEVLCRSAEEASTPAATQAGQSAETDEAATAATAATAEVCGVGPGAPLGTGPLEAAEFGTRGYRDPTRGKG